MKTDDLQSLVTKAQRGDEVALARLFDRFYDRIHAYAFRRVLDTDVAEDIASQTFMKLVKNFSSFEWRHKHSFSGYIFRIANNEVNQHLRKNKRISAMSEDALDAVSDPTDSTHDIVEAELDAHRQYVELNKVLKGLKPRQQDIVHMYSFEDLSHREIAEALKMKEASYVGIEVEKLLKSVSKPEAKSPRRKAIKETIMQEFNNADHSAQPTRKGFLSGWAPKLTVSGLALSVLAVFGFSVLLGGPLTAQEALAQAVENYSDIDTSKQGRYQYSKNRSISTFNGVEEVTIWETWEDLEGENFRSQSTREDGTVMDIFMVLEGQSYSYFNEEAMGEIYNIDDSFDVNLDIGELFEGAAEAGLTLDELDTLSMREVDDRLEAAGYPRANEEMFGTSDFPAYTMTPEELDAYFENADGEIDFDELDALWPEEDIVDSGIFEEPIDDEQFASIDSFYQTLRWATKGKHC